MKILITGASGFLGTALIPKLIAKGGTVYGLSRHPPAPSDNLIPFQGDITLPNLGLEEKEVPKGIRSVYHLAAIHRLNEDKDGSIWKTNVTGTENVIKFCLDHNIKRLYFCSTAYTIGGKGRNPYEKSKILCEKMVTESGIPGVTIFKPSIVMGTKESPYPGHFSQFVVLMVKVHQRAEIIRRKIEGTLRLPILEPVFRVRGNSEGYLNLVLIDEVVKAMAEIRHTGIYWLTNPNPPTLGQLISWVGESILVNARFEKEFKHNPLEKIYQQKAKVFGPYLQGDDFPSHLRDHPLLTKDFIHETIINTLFGNSALP